MGGAAVKPQELSIGLRDVLALLVPGAVLLIALPVNVTGWLQGRLRLGDGPPDATLFLLVFLIAAIAAGSLLSGLAGLADDYVDEYIKWRAGRLPSRGIRGTLSRSIHKLEEAKKLAEKLEACVLPAALAGSGGDVRPWTTRSFWWNYLRLNCPEAIAELDRIEGIQKQFRSFVIVALFIAIAALLEPIEWPTLFGAGPLSANPGEAIAPLGAYAPWLLFLPSLIICVFCFFSYVGYRVRFARRLYELAIVHALPETLVLNGSKNFFRSRVEPPPTSPGGEEGDIGSG